MKETKEKKRIFSDAASDDESNEDSDADSDDESNEEDTLEETDNRWDGHTNGGKFMGVVITTQPPKGWYTCDGL